MDIFSEASPPTGVHADMSEKKQSVTVSWSSTSDGITGYILYYYYYNNSVTEKTAASHERYATLVEENERVYSVSIQALSKHLPSIVVGPFYVRGT